MTIYRILFDFWVLKNHRNFRSSYFCDSILFCATYKKCKLYNHGLGLPLLHLKGFYLVRRAIDDLI